MWSQLIDPTADKLRAKLFWAVIGVVLLGQLVAIYMLCSQQVRNAHVRETAIQVQRTAINDCLQYLPNATVGSCASRGSARTAATSPVPVNFIYR